MQKNIRERLVQTGSVLGMASALALYIFLAFLASAGLRTVLSERFGVDMPWYAFILAMIVVLLLIMPGKRRRRRAP